MERFHHAAANAFSDVLNVNLHKENAESRWLVANEWHESGGRTFVNATDIAGASGAFVF
jgi:hypothetical protein